MATNINLQVYELRLKKERNITAEEIQARMRWDMPILSQNSKCSISLDLPISNCTPTKACASVCYASQGRQIYHNAIVKSLAVEKMIAQDPEHVARKMVDEAADREIRIAGSGEILPRHKTLLDYVNGFGGRWWGFTRRKDTHRLLPSLMFSIDATTPDSVMEYVRDEVPINRRAYLRLPGERSPPLEVAVTFPTHGFWTNYHADIPPHETDCPAVRGSAKCRECKRCY